LKVARSTSALTSSSSESLKRILLIISLFFSVLSLTDAVEAERPNILFILSDDVGYGDLGCYGATLAKTPHLDRLAREGCRFTDAHSPASMCTPTRRALLTGSYSWRQSAGAAILDGNAPLCIPQGALTLPSLLKRAGYITAVIGKWHLGLGVKGGPDWNGEIKPGPLEIGFDRAFIMPATGDRVPCVYVENHRVVGLDPADPIQLSYREKVGGEPTGKDNPDLLKLKSRDGRGHNNTIVNGIARIGWMTGGKSARWVDEEMADTFAAKTITFIEQHRSSPFFIYLATHGIHAPQAPHPRFKGAGRCGTRGEALAELDDTVGQVLATLDRLGLAGKTLVVFTSDNGGVDEDGYESIINPAHRCNGALRGSKGTQFEGGHRVPFIARWPGRIEPGSENGELIALTDMCATFAALTGVDLPADAALDSMNVLPALLGQSHPQAARETFIAHGAGTHGPFSIRQGPWKLVQSPGGGIGFTPNARERPARAPLLFNLDEDLGESKDLAAKHPEKVEELMKLLALQREQGCTRPGAVPPKP
jgi:arylsulfatase A-like enzyme